MGYKYIILRLETREYPKCTERKDFEIYSTNSFIKVMFNFIKLILTEKDTNITLKVDLF